MSSNSLCEDDAGSVSVESASILCEDELSVIFNNACVTTRDLLNFRLVNKSWCDAATTVLRQRDACYVALDMKIMVLPEEDPDPGPGPELDDQWQGFKLFFCKYGDKKANLNELSQLTELMSSSLKFPTSNFHVHSCCYSVTNYADYPDLMWFFQLHGEKVQTLRPHGCVSQENLLDIFFDYAPKLKCLDLSHALLMTTSNRSRKSEGDTTTASKWPSKVLPSKYLIFPNSFDANCETHRAIMHLLLSSPSKLSCIENVKIGTLPFVLEEGKGRLIKSFEISTITTAGEFTLDLDTFVSVMKQFFALNPKLSKLTLDLDDENFDFFVAALPSINTLMECSKDSVQNLKLSVNQCDSLVELNIPPMQNLKFITLSGTFWRDTFVGRRLAKTDSEKNVPTFKDRSSPTTDFPSLLKASFNDQDFSTDENFLSFFRKSYFDSGADDVSESISLSSVETLDIQNCTLPQISEPNLITQTFPNIRILKIVWNWSDYENLNGSFWTMCPQVEFLEIYDNSLEANDRDMALHVDSFFTGFPLEMCRKLLIAHLPKYVNNQETLELLRTAPSVWDLRHLKELKLQFYRRLWTEFASHVTGAYAFNNMPNAKFIISYDPEIFCSSRVPNQYENEDDGARCFTSIKPYVQIVQEKRIDCQD